MRLEHLEYFVETVNQKSINKAAKVLYVSQATLSLSIIRMEEEIGTKLLYRTKKGVVPTMQGQQMYNDALDIIANTHSVMEKWKTNVQNDYMLEGDIPVLTIPSASNLVSFFAVQELREIAPCINLNVQEDHLHEDTKLLTENLATTGINIGIGSYTDAQADDFFRSFSPDIWHVDSLFSDCMSIYVSNKHPFSKKKSFSVEDCKSLTLAYYQHPDRAYVPSFLHFFDVSKAFGTNTKENIMRMIVENMAVGVFPYKIGKHDFYFRNNIISAIPFDDSFHLPNINYYIIYRNNLSESEKKVVDIIRFCAKYYFD